MTLRGDDIFLYLLFFVPCPAWKEWRQSCPCPHWSTWRRENGTSSSKGILATAQDSYVSRFILDLDLDLDLMSTSYITSYLSPNSVLRSLFWCNFQCFQFHDCICDIVCGIIVMILNATSPHHLANRQCRNCHHLAYVPSTTHNESDKWTE